MECSTYLPSEHVRTHCTRTVSYASELLEGRLTVRLTILMAHLSTYSHSYWIYESTAKICFVGRCLENFCNGYKDDELSFPSQGIETHRAHKHRKKSITSLMIREKHIKAAKRF